MLARMVADRLARHGIHYGWVIVFVTFVTSVTTAGAVGLPGALIIPLTREFGWNTEQISGALALRLLLFGLMGPFTAALMERYGVRRIVLAAISLILVGLLSALVMTQVWHLILFWGVIVGVGTGLTAIVLGAVISTRWFVNHRGLVLGLLTASNATGQLAFLPVAAWLVDHGGWRLALLPSVAGLVLAAVLVFLFMVDRPSDLGLKALGDTGSSPVLVAQPQAAFARAFSVLGDAATTRAFWILSGTFFICGVSTAGLIQTHFIPFCVDFGLAAVTAASVLAMMGAFDFIGTIGSGWLSDRFDSRALLFWYYGLRGLSLLYLPYSTFTFYGLSLFAIFYGLDWIATVPPTVRLATRHFGRERAPIVFGWIFAGHQIGAATSAFAAGLMRTEYHTYLPAFFAAGLMCLVASCVIWFLRSPDEALRIQPAPAE